MILVTGANGFLGSYICRKLFVEQVPFIAMVRPSSDLRLLAEIKEKINIHHGDILDPFSVTNILPKVDTIIHCAALVSFEKKDKYKMHEVNITGTKNMVDLALADNIKYFIHISSVAAIGRTQSVGVLDETNKWQESKLNTNYGESKYLAELEVWRGIMEGLNAVILNPSVILGPGDWTKGSARLFKYVMDEKSFYTNGLLNYIDVRDVASIVFKLLKKRTTGERYILNAGKVDFKSFFDQIAEKLDKKPPGIRANKFLIRLALFFQTIKSWFSSSRPIITRETARVSGSKIYFDNSKIRRELNHSFVPLTQTIDWVCTIFLKEKSLQKNK